MNKSKLFLLLTIVAIFAIGCKEESVQTPKPRSFPRVVYPEKIMYSLILHSVNLLLNIRIMPLSFRTPHSLAKSLRMPAGLIFMSHNFKALYFVLIILLVKEFT